MKRTYTESGTIGIDISYLNPKNLILYFCLFFSVGSLSAQDDFITTNQDSNQNIIRFIGQYPNSDNKHNEGLKSKLGEFVLGKKPELVKKPINIIANSPDHFWILDQGNGILIEKEHDSGKVPSQINKKAGSFQSLVGLCFLSREEMLFTDSRLNQIFSFSPENKIMEALNDSLKLQQPTGIAYCSLTEEIWVTETGAHRISVLNKNGEIVKQIGERGNNPGNFNFPTHIWIDSSGKVYVVDAMNFRIQIFNSSGEFLFSFGEAGDATGYFARPKGIATDSFGNIYIADALFHVIQIFDSNGKFLYYFGLQGQGPGQFWMPAGIYIDSNNYIYVADSYNARIQIFKLVNENL